MLRAVPLISARPPIPRVSVVRALALAALSFVGASSHARAEGAATPPPRIAPGPRLEYCSLLTRCGLSPVEGICTAETSTGVPDLVYDEARCAEPKDLAARGVSPSDLTHFSVYRFMGKRYRVVYTITGQLPLSPERLAFVIDDLPLAAKLTTAFRKRTYTAEYLDETHRTFKGSKQGTLDGQATRLTGSTAEGRLVYFGYGRSKLGFWKLGGWSLAWFEWKAATLPKTGLEYSLKVLATPDGAFVNRIMSLGLFRGLVEGQIRDVIEDIEGATADLAKKGLAGASRRTEWSDDEKARLEKLLQLP